MIFLFSGYCLDVLRYYMKWIKYEKSAESLELITSTIDKIKLNKQNAKTAKLRDRNQLRTRGDTRFNRFNPIKNNCRGNRLV